MGELFNSFYNFIMDTIDAKTEEPKKEIKEVKVEENNTPKINVDGSSKIIDDNIISDDEFFDDFFSDDDE